MVEMSVLRQYEDLKREIVLIRAKIEYLEREIPRLEQEIQEIENGLIVKDKVRGGMGGWQTFTIEGIPFVDLEEKTAKLVMKRNLLITRREMVKSLEERVENQINEVEAFLAGIDDSVIRQIVHYRYVEGMPWSKVADRIGGYNTEGSVKMMFKRYLEGMKNDKVVTNVTT